jgi:hypothetical protein
MAAYGEYPNVPTDSTTVRHANLSEFASVLVRPRNVPAGGPHGAGFRRSSRVVQHPRRMFFRKDGQVTIQGANKGNTVTVSPRDMILVGTHPAGNIVILNIK